MRILSMVSSAITLLALVVFIIAAIVSATAENGIDPNWILVPFLTFAILQVLLLCIYGGQEVIGSLEFKLSTDGEITLIQLFFFPITLLLYLFMFLIKFVLFSAVFHIAIWSNFKETVELAREMRMGKEPQANKKPSINTKKVIKWIAIIVPVVICIAALVIYASWTTTTKIPDEKYTAAMALMDAGKYDEAISAFEALDGYKDSADKIKKCQTAILTKQYTNRYNEILALVDQGEYLQAAKAFYAMGDFKDAKEQSLALWSKITQRNIISAGSNHTDALKNTGHVVSVGQSRNGRNSVSYWNDIVDICSGYGFSVGVKANGTVLTAGDKIDGVYSVRDWEGIVAVTQVTDFYHYVYGLKADGTVVSTDSRQLDWTDIIAIEGGGLLLGLKADGTVVVDGDDEFGNPQYGAEYSAQIDTWRDIIAISAGANHAVGLKADGTVVAVGNNKYGQCDVSGWKDIVAISAGTSHTLGLKADGTVVAVGENSKGPCDVADWNNIVAISAGNAYSAAIKADGTAVATGWDNLNSVCDVGSWRNLATAPIDLT